MSVQKKILVMVLVGIMGMGVVCSSLVWAEQKKIIYTTMDLKQDYEILDLVVWLETITSGSGFGDAMAGGYNTACKRIEEQAKKLGADAVIGYRVDIQNITRETAGRVLIYGTAVKFK